MEVGCKVAIRKHYGAKPDGALELFDRDGKGGPSGHASAKSQRYENVEPHSRYTHVKVEPQSSVMTSVEPQSNLSRTVDTSCRRSRSTLIGILFRCIAYRVN